MRRDGPRGAFSGAFSGAWRSLEPGARLRPVWAVPDAGTFQRSARAQRGGFKRGARARPEMGWIGIEPQDQLGRPLRDGARDPIAEAERYLTAFFSAAPAVNLGTRVAAI